LVAFLCFLGMAVTEPSLAIVWDEGYTLGREARVREWCWMLFHPGRTRLDPFEYALVQPDGDSGPKVPRPDLGSLRSVSDLFRPEVIAWYWPFSREEPHGHPPFYAVVGLLGDLVLPGWPTLTRARFGPMLAFSLTAGSLFGFLARRWGNWAGFVGAGAWCLHPHLFALGHYAHYDGLLSCLWVGSVLAFWKAEESGRAFWAVTFGVLAGWAADTKLTGWLLPAPFVVWTLVYRSRSGLKALLLGGLVGLLTIYAFNPPLWSDPIDGLRRFFGSNLSRVHTINLPVFFLGRVFKTPAESLPWYNSLLWTAAATPAGFLFLALARLIRFDRRKPEPFGVLVLLNWSFLLLLKAMPHTPGHDGVRQFLPAFGMLALLAGLGARSLIDRLGGWGKALSVLAVGEGVLSLAVMMPVPLSYFSPLVGGLPGAAWIGLEPTYYWDALDGATCEWLDRHTSESGLVRFSTFPLSFLYAHNSGFLRPGPLRYEAPGRAEWYVVQNRPGMLRTVDRALITQGRPAFVRSRLGVPLLWVFPHSEAERLAPEQDDPVPGWRKGETPPEGKPNPSGPT
jgi:4-amino-4-deoxy-L-arabinose transferase-like glycosyltransferase